MPLTLIFAWKRAEPVWPAFWLLGQIAARRADPGTTRIAARRAELDRHPDHNLVADAASAT